MFRILDFKTDAVYELATYKDVFNPLLNKSTLTKDRNIGSKTKLSRYIEFLKALCTRESILACPSMFIHSYGGRNIPSVEEVLEFFDEDRLWTLPFFYLRKEIVRGEACYNVRMKYVYNYNAQRIEGRIPFHYIACGMDEKSNQWSNVAQTKAFIRATSNLWNASKIAEILRVYPDGYITNNMECYSPAVCTLWTISQGSGLYYTASLYHNDRGAGAEALDGLHAAMQLAAGTHTLVVGFSGNSVTLKLVPKVNKDNKAYLYHLFDRKANILDVLPNSLTLPEEHKPRLYGLELELTSDHTIQTLVDAVIEPFFVCKYDGSIRGSKAACYELVTAPMSYKAHKHSWGQFFKKLGYDGFDTSKKTNNGIHIHVDKRAFDGNYRVSQQRPEATNYHLQRFEWMFVNPANYDFILAISEREGKELQAPAGDGGYAHIVRFDQFMEHPIRKVAAFNEAPRLVRGVRGAVNIHPNGNTVEIRLFKGIVSEAVIFKNLEFVDSLIEFTRKMPFQHCTLEDYLDWLDRQPKNQYKILRKFLETIKLPAMRETSSLVEKIFLDIDPKNIMKRLNVGFNVTQRHVDLLNKRFETEMFNFKDGKIVQAEPKEWYKKLDKNPNVEARPAAVNRQEGINQIIRNIAIRQQDFAAQADLNWQGNVMVNDVLQPYVPAALPPRRQGN